MEQVAFSPATLVPGIGLSPDKLLQGRLLIYDDTQCHRIGPNYKQLYINRPRAAEATDHWVGGRMHIDVKNRFPHYAPSVFGGPKPDPNVVEPPLKTDGDLSFYDYPNEGTDEDYYGQVKDFWRILSEEQRDHLCHNIATSLEKVKEPKIVSMMMDHFSKVDSALKDLVQRKMEERKSGKKTESEKMYEEFVHRLSEIKASS